VSQTESLRDEAPQVDKPWTIFGVDYSSITFKSPEGKCYVASCVAGRFDYECTYAFHAFSGKPLAAGGMCKQFPQRRDGALHTFRIQYPKMSFGKPVTERGFHGFSILTPGNRRVDMFFEFQPAPLALKAQIERFFTEPQEDDNGTGQLRQEPPPAAGRPDRGQGPGQFDSDQLQGVEEHGGKRQAGGRREAAEPRRTGRTYRKPVQRLTRTKRLAALAAKLAP
jgi:hypothetical protein